MFETQIAAGAKLLDEKIPGWEGRQDLKRLNLGTPCNCVLGQSEKVGDYWTTVMKLFPNAQTDREIFDLSIAHGFSVESSGSLVLSLEDMERYDQLTLEWKQLITERRKQKA